MTENAVPTLIQRLSVEARGQWRTMTELAVRLPAEQVDATAEALAASMMTGVDSVKRKLQAIKHVASLGYGAEEIFQMGQEKVLGDFGKSKRQANYTETVVMKWNIPGSQRELVQKQERRVKSLLGIVTSEDFWDWWLAQIENATDEEIRQSAGEGDAESKTKRP